MLRHEARRDSDPQCDKRKEQLKRWNGFPGHFVSLAAELHGAVYRISE